MKKTLLATALVSLLCTTTHADTITQPIATPSATAVTTQQPTQAINCQYRIPAEKISIETPLILTWAKEASVQSFQFSADKLDDELATLKSCYTDQGWLSFNEALQKSGNITAIKAHHLTVSSQVDGELIVTPVKDNQWKVTVPIQAVYQNDQNKMTQLLNVDLVIGRKLSGDLGIMQMIATPRKTISAEQPVQSTQGSPASKTAHP